MCFYLPLQKFSLEYRSEIKLWDKKIHIINPKTCHLHHKFSSNFTHMPYNAPNTKNIYKGGNFWKDSHERWTWCVHLDSKNLPDYSIMENPLTKKMEDYQKHKKQKSCKSCDLQDSVAEREGFYTTLPASVTRWYSSAVFRHFRLFCTKNGAELAQDKTS